MAPPQNLTGGSEAPAPALSAASLGDSCGLISTITFRAVPTHPTESPPDAAPPRSAHRRATSHSTAPWRAATQGGVAGTAWSMGRPAGGFVRAAKSAVGTTDKPLVDVDFVPRSKKLSSRDQLPARRPRSRRPANGLARCQGELHLPRRCRVQCVIARAFMSSRTLNGRFTRPHLAGSSSNDDMLRDLQYPNARREPVAKSIRPMDNADGDSTEGGLIMLSRRWTSSALLCV